MNLCSTTLGQTITLCRRTNKEGAGGKKGSVVFMKLRQCTGYHVILIHHKKTSAEWGNFQIYPVLRIRITLMWIRIQILHVTLMSIRIRILLVNFTADPDPDSNFHLDAKAQNLEKCSDRLIFHLQTDA
jgi:hypothetical protein